MRWKRMYHVFVPDGSEPWARTHASTPWGTWRDDGLLRVHYTTRDSTNRSHIGWVDLDPDHGFAVMRVASEPVVVPGPPGLFDDSGTSMGCIVEHAGRELLFYVGWNLRVTVPWSNTIGLATRKTGDESFVKYGRVPVMDRSEEDPFSLSYPAVLVEGDTLTMWYGTNDAWGSDLRSMMHAVGRATSRDGVAWRRDAVRAIQPVAPHEYAISRPMVRRTPLGYEMFYSHRATTTSPTYRVGWATSGDGIEWDRRDGEIGFDVSDGGWDSEMVCYPFVFDHRGTTYMLYNGNSYGATGFGVASLEP